MTLLNASLAAAGLGCVAIPIIIHLLMNRRRKPIMWGAMRFILEAYRRQQRRLVVEKWLLLVARCLLVALIGLALGKPLVGAIAGVGGGHHIFILIDNSLASSAKAPGEPSALDRHKTAAKALVASLQDRAASLGGGPAHIGLIALAGPAEGLVMPPSTDAAGVTAVIDSLAAADSRADLPGALAMVAAAIGAPGAGGMGAAGSGGAQGGPDPTRTAVAILSDFAEGSLDLSATGDTLGATRLPDGVRLLVSEPAHPAQTNISIAGVEPLRSVLVGQAGEGQDLVRVLLRRSGAGMNQAQATLVRADLRLLDAAGAPIGSADNAANVSGDRATVRWSPGQDSAVAVVPLALDAPTARAARSGAGTTNGGIIVASIDNDAVAGDNRWARPVDVRAALKVGVVAPSQFGRIDRADKLDPGAWARLAIIPAGEAGGGGGGGGDIEITDIEPASLDAGRLLGLDALVLVRPDSVPEEAWPRIRVFVDSGGMVLIAPPPNVTINLWADPMTRALGLNWSLTRESKALATPARVVARKPAPTDEAGAPAAGVLALIESELDDLLRPVSVRRLLPMAAPPETGSTLLALEDGTPILWLGSPESPSAAAPQTSARRPSTDSPAPAGRGLVAYLAVALDLDWSDLPAKPLMVPLTQELLRQGVGQARGAWWAIAGSRPPAPPRSRELFPVAALSAPDSASRAADAGTLTVDSAGLAAQPVRFAGVYRAFDAAGASRGLVSVNADPRAGRLGAQEREAVGVFLRAAFGLTGPVGPTTDPVVWLSPGEASAPTAGAPTSRAVPIAGAFASLFGKGDRGSPFWFPLLAIGLAIAVLELWLARRASHAYADSSVVATGLPAPALSPGGSGGAEKP